MAAQLSTSSVKEDKLEIFKDALYDACRATYTTDHLFSQDDLLDLDVIPNRDIAVLLEVIQKLNNEKLLIPCAGRDGLAFKWRDVSEAEKYKQLQTDEQVMVYSLIDDAGANGISSAMLVRRIGMHDNVFTATVKQLMKKRLIDMFYHVDQPSKKMYIKMGLRPSEKATGGPWYTDQNLDEAFIEVLCKVIYNFVKAKSAVPSKRREASSAGRSVAPKKGVIKGGVEKSKKRPADQISGDSKPDPAPPTTDGATVAHPPKPPFLPMPAGYTEYPTVRDIARFIAKNEIAKQTVLSEDDVQKLVDVLTFDGLIEPVKVAGKLGYRIVRIAKQGASSWQPRKENETEETTAPIPYRNGFTEVPCGRCPVFEVCEEGGPVGPSNCEYFQEWLGID